jgi:FKBP-type peptidyl-prolyl cis-trans isomerase
MMIRSLSYGVLFMLFMVLTACEHKAPENKSKNPKEYEEPLMEANKRVVRTEAQHIEDYLRRYKWNMTETGSGLYYMIYEEGHGMLPRKGMMAEVSYEIKVITGDVVYSSEEEGLLSFVIGNGEVISGLEEGILLLNVGDKAKFIIPSHLAYGLVGDGKRIPAKTTLIYDIELVSITESN